MMTTTTYTIPNISCNHCVHTITTELTDLAGVKEVVADLASKKVKVTFEPPASLEKIEELLVEIDYPPAR
jgi:copper chaperone CopZ